jgi:PIN domain nuclease of toxin-antitoxin system
MRLIVDTQCWLWMNAEPSRLGRSARAWEITIKVALGKLRLPERPADYVADRLTRTRTLPLPISLDHALGIADLPPLHRDPFDRLLVSQARIERLPLLTADRQLSAYDVDIIDA